MANYLYHDSNMYYEVYGEGYPVLLLHGWGIDHRYLTGCMEPVFQNFPNAFKRYYVDLPGMGKSLPGSIRCTNDIVDLLLHFITEEIQSDSLLLAGNSYGGLLARAINCRIPEKISGMILICPATDVKHRHLPAMRTVKKDETFLETLSEKERSCFRAMNAILTQDSWERYRRDIYPAVLENEGSDYLAHVLDGSAPDYLVSSEQTCNCPVLILTGKQDSRVGYEDQLLWRSQYPRFTYLALEGAAHNLPVDRPQIFTAVVTDWINQLSEQ